MKEDDSSEVKIKGYDLVCDNLLDKGRARSAIYIKESFQYSVRHDLMDRETPEVYLEVNMKKRKKKVIIGQFYREMSQVRGKKAIDGSGDHDKQKERLKLWTTKVKEKISSTEEVVCIGGDFNASLGGTEEHKDAYGEILEEELVEEGRFSMVVKESTHQEIRHGKKCRERSIDHIYCNSTERLKDTRAVTETGSHHKVIMTSLMERMELKGPQKH